MVIAVVAVLHQELPVCANGVVLLTADDGHGFGRLIDHQVEVFLGVAQILFEGAGAHVKVHEAQAPVVREAGDRNKVAPILILEIPAVAVCAGKALELALGAKNPAVVEALKVLGVAFRLPAHLGAPVGAGVEEGVKGAAGVAVEDQISLGNEAPYEITFLGDFRFMADVQPAFVEDSVVLGIHDRRVRKRFARHLKQAELFVFSN